MSTFWLTGRDDHGMRVEAKIQDRESAERLMAAWRRSGFTQVALRESGPPQPAAANRPSPDHGG